MEHGNHGAQRVNAEQQTPSPGGFMEGRGGEGSTRRRERKGRDALHTRSIGATWASGFSEVMAPMCTYTPMIDLEPSPLVGVADVSRKDVSSGEAASRAILDESLDVKGTTKKSKKDKTGK